MEVLIDIPVNIFNVVRYFVLALLLSRAFEIELSKWMEKIARHELLKYGSYQISDGMLIKRRTPRVSFLSRRRAVAALSILFIIAVEVALEFASDARSKAIFRDTTGQANIVITNANRTVDVRPFHYLLLNSKIREVSGVCFNFETGSYSPTFISRDDVASHDVDKVQVRCPVNGTSRESFLDFSRDFDRFEGILAPLERMDFESSEDARYASHIFSGQLGERTQRNDLHFNELSNVERREIATGAPIGRVKFINTPAEISNVSSNVKESEEEQGRNFVVLEYKHPKRRIDCLLEDGWEGQFTIHACAYTESEIGTVLGRPVEFDGSSMDIDITSRLESIQHLMMTRGKPEQTVSSGKVNIHVLQALAMTRGTRDLGHQLEAKVVALGMASGLGLFLDDQRTVEWTYYHGEIVRPTFKVWGLGLLCTVSFLIVVSFILTCILSRKSKVLSKDLNTPYGIARRWLYDKDDELDSRKSGDGVYLVLRDCGHQIQHVSVSASSQGIPYNGGRVLDGYCDLHHCEKGVQDTEAPIPG